MSKKMIDASRLDESGNEILFVNPKNFPDLGNVVTGSFVETYEFEGSTKSGKKFKSLNHKIKSEDGRTVILNGSSRLNGLMKKVRAGEDVQVEYLGKKDPSDSMSPHLFKVLVAER